MILSLNILYLHHQLTEILKSLKNRDWMSNGAKNVHSSMDHRNYTDCLSIIPQSLTSLIKVGLLSNSACFSVIFHYRNTDGINLT